MARSKPSVPDLLRESLAALQTSKVLLGEQLGVSSRTMTRWFGGKTAPPAHHLAALARLVTPRDTNLATRLAEASGTTLAEANGEVAVLSPARRALCDSVVCAGADATDASPRAFRTELRAALRRARELGLSLAELELALAPQESRKA